MSDYFDNRLGQIDQGLWRPRIVGRLRDLVHDLGARLAGGVRKTAAIAAAAPARKILVLGVAHPDRPGDLEEVVTQLRRSRHEVAVSVVTMQPGLGKFQNITRALAQVTCPLSVFDWVVITDDDVGMPADFLDRFIALAEHAGLMIAQPAHRFFSYTTFAITQRRWGSLVRATPWVEIGPLTALRQETLADLMPFPVSRWDWGLDIYWAQLADRKGWRMGVVDGVPIEHRRPVAGGYDSDVAMAEAVQFLTQHNVTFTRADCHGWSKVVVDWRPEPVVAVDRRSPSIVHGDPPASPH